ncbi:MAG: ScpA family protein [Geminicoccaceae bacterium]
MADEVPPDAFIVDLGEFEGPLDLLLDLARTHKVDLKRISILALADQYLDYLKRMQAQKLEIAAEYLVMAAWLAYLKSQLLLPPPERAEPDAETLAEDLAARLRKLEAIRAATTLLADRPRLGEVRLPRGMAQGVEIVLRPVWKSTLGELMGAYGAVMQRGRQVWMKVPPRRLDSVEAALDRLARQLTGHDWRELAAFLPESLGDPLWRRSAVAAGLVATLELARTGQIDVEQTAPFGPIMIRRR